MSDIALLPAPRVGADIERDLAELAERRMLAPARKAGYELQLVGATVLPQHRTIYRNPWGTWLFVDHLDDPTAKEYKGKIPIPENLIPRLGELRQQGVQPEFVWVVHQLPNSYREGDPIPRLVPAHRELREKDERLKLRLVHAMHLYLKGVFTILAGAAAAPFAVAGGVAAGVGLDPIIFGGVKHPQLPVVMWCVLAQWEWE